MLKRSHGEIRRSLSLLTSNLEELTRTTSLILEDRKRIDQERYHDEQEEILKRLNLTVTRLEAVYAIDNGLNPGQPLRNHKANQAE